MDTKERFHQIYEMYGPMLYRFCLMQMKNQADAEDVMQEVFLKRLYRAPHFDSPEHEKRWLYRVAINQCKDEWKRRHRSDLRKVGDADHLSFLGDRRHLFCHNLCHAAGNACIDFIKDHRAYAAILRFQVLDGQHQSAQLTAGCNLR